MDAVAKEGQMFLQGVKFGKRIWRRTWVMLFEPSAAGIGRLEMFDVRDGQSARPAVLKKADKQVLRLAECLSVTPAPGESCPTGCSALYLNTTKRIYTLAAPPGDEWVPALCQLAFQRHKGGDGVRGEEREESVTMAQNDLYSTWSPTQFQVRVASTVASVRCSMYGSYLLSPEKESLSLLDMKTGRVMFDWQYRALRKFGVVKEGVSIETGRRCHTGEGQFIFQTGQGRQIYRAIEEAVMHQSVQELLSEATALTRGQRSKPPPPPPPGRPAPKMDVAARTLPLPVPLPVPLPRPLGPKPRLPACKPRAKEVNRAPAKPLSKPRTQPPPRVPRGPPETGTCPGDRGDRGDHDYEVCDWPKGPEPSPDRADAQLYSVVRPHHRPTGTKPVQEQRHDPRPPRTPPPESLRSFKQTLADTLIRGRACARPPLPPKPPRQADAHQSANDYEDLDRFGGF